MPHVEIAFITIFTATREMPSNKRSVRGTTTGAQASTSAGGFPSCCRSLQKHMLLWGFFNLAVGYLLVCRVGSFNLRKTRHVLLLGAGILIMPLMLARGFGRFHGGL